MLKFLRALLLFGALMGAPVSAKQPKAGEQAPDFQLTLVDGNKVSLNDLKGQVVVLNFWATWCVPCRTELPLLDGYYVAHKNNGLHVFAVATEDSVPIYQMKKLFAVLHVDPVRKIKGPYDAMGAVPTNIVIGRDGVIRYAKPGAFDLNALNNILIPLLKEPAPVR